MTRDDLFATVHAASAETLPAIIGDLESAKALAWARLTTPSPGPLKAEDTEGNISVKVAALRLGVSDRWVYKNARRLPFVRRIGRRVLCSAHGVAEWNARQRG